MNDFGLFGNVLLSGVYVIVNGSRYLCRINGDWALSSDSDKAIKLNATSLNDLYYRLDNLDVNMASAIIEILNNKL